jgi:hypothetical protein
MKIKFKIHIVIIAGLFTLNACCSKEDLAGNDIGKFIFLDSIGNNIFFGPSKSLNRDSIFIKNGNSGYQKLTINANDLDSIILINFNYADTSYIKFSNNDIDTFSLTYEVITGKTSAGNCKLSAVVLNGIKYNGTALSSDFQNPIKIYK